MASMSSTTTTLSTISISATARVSQKTQTLTLSPSSSARASSSSSSSKPVSISFACSKHSPLLPPIIKRASSFRVNSSVNDKDQQKPQVGTGGGDGGGDSGGSGGDGRKGLGGGGSGGDHNEGDEEVNKKQMAMSMSQKLTLGYAALVGVGGVMGYLKSGSQKSLAAGGLSSLLLYFVYTQLPTRPALASFLGMGLSAALLFVMGSRYKKSRKVFPAGVVSLVSLVMTGGYLHGIMRTMH